MSKKIIVIFSLAIFLIAGSVLADQQTWTVGNFKYTRSGNGLIVTQINSPTQTKPKIKKPNATNNESAAQPQFLDIASIASIPDINVSQGTDLTFVSLPDTVISTMSDGSAKTFSVLWDNGTPTYDGNTAGTYVFSGTPVFSGNFTNTKSIKVTVDVIVGSQTATPTENTLTSQSLNISSVAPISDINVAYGSALSSASLPTEVIATMSDSSTQNIAVTWDNGTPTYDPNTAGTYIISGTLTLPDNVTNADNLKASVNVIVLAQTTSSTDLLQTTTPSTGGDIIQNATSSLLNGVGNFFNFIFSPFKRILNIK